MARRSKIDYRTDEQIAWDERLNALTEEMIECRANRRHIWRKTGDYVIDRERRTHRVMTFRRTELCDNGCQTTRTHVMDCGTWERVGNYHYEWADEYKVVGETIDRRALNREKYIRSNPTLFSYLLSGGEPITDENELEAVAA